MTVREKILSYVNDVEYISFDIFDTLVLRMVRRPTKIFDKTYDMDPSLFPQYITAREWRNIRQKAETFAQKKKGRGEVNLQDIYRELPEIITHPNEIMENEILSEIGNAFLNYEIRDVLYELHYTYHKKIILTSDMYLAKTVIEDILSGCGFDANAIEKIHVSSETGTKKST